VQIITKTKATAPRKTNVSVVGDGKRQEKRQEVRRNGTTRRYPIFTQI